jgi:hypothetical protein
MNEMRRESRMGRGIIITMDKAFVKSVSIIETNFT